jgi:hypothetical protein
VDAKCFLGKLSQNLRTSGRPHADSSDHSIEPELWCQYRRTNIERQLRQSGTGILVRVLHVAWTLLSASCRQLTANDRVKNKCGPGQPPGPHWFGGISCGPFPRTRHGGVHLSHALRRTRAKRCHSADRHLRSKLRKSICSTTMASGQSCRVWRTLEEAATPGQPVARRSAFLEEPSRQFTLENCQEPPALPQCSGRAHRTSRTDVSHSALRTLALQAKSRASLCRNCGWLRFLVESDGKTGRNF